MQKYILHPRAVFISLEGIDGSGKTSQLKRLQNFFEKQNRPVLLFREPGNTALGEQIRSLLLEGENIESDWAELFLFLAARAELLRCKIVPALQEGKIVICDRFIDSTVVYQGKNQEDRIRDIRFLNQKILEGISLTKTFLFDLEPSLAMQRLAQRKEKNRYDRVENLAFLREAYLQEQKKHPERIQIIDASKSEEEIFSVLIQSLREILSLP